MFYTLIRDELHRRNLYLPPALLERLCASIGCHLINYVNLHQPFLFKQGRPLNCRLHLLVVAPSGWLKSTIFENFFEEGGLLREANPYIFKTALKSTFSKESWMGVVDRVKGEAEAIHSPGVIGNYREGFIGADEYGRLPVLMDGEGAEHDEVYLMKALDTSTVEKEVAYGSAIEKGVGMTLWTGFRPRPFNSTSGLARRFGMQKFFPTWDEARRFNELMEKGGGRPSEGMGDEFGAAILRSLDNIVAWSMGEPDFTEVIRWCETQKRYVFHFERAIYKKMALGLSIALGDYPMIHMRPELEVLFNDERDTRRVFRNDPWDEIVRTVVHGEPGHYLPMLGGRGLKVFLEDAYQIGEVEAMEKISGAKRRGKIYRVKDGYSTEKPEGL